MIFCKKYLILPVGKWLENAPSKCSNSAGTTLFKRRGKSRAEAQWAYQPELTLTQRIQNCYQKETGHKLTTCCIKVNVDSRQWNDIKALKPVDHTKKKLCHLYVTPTVAYPDQGTERVISIF